VKKLLVRPCRELAGIAQNYYCIVRYFCSGPDLIPAKSCMRVTLVSDSQGQALAAPRRRCKLMRLKR
jgi:hypothetical protein